MRRGALYLANYTQRSPSVTPVTGFLPMSVVPSYNLNAGGDYPPDTGVNMFFNGQLNQTVVVGYGKVNPVDYYIFPLYTLYDDVTITKVEFYHHTGTGSPTIVYGMADYNDSPVQLASYGGSPTPDIGWITFDDFDPSEFQYVKILAGNYKPAQMRFTATYTPKVPPTLYPLQSIPFSNMCGVNMFEWNYMDDFGDHRAVLPSSRAAMKTFVPLRHYLDWDKLEHVQGQYTFSPSSPGGWDYDVMYTDMHANGFYVMGCIKQQPNWMEAAYPANLQNSQNAPVKYVSGAQADKSLPASYTDYGKVLFQYVARYGSNTTIDPALVTPHTVGPDNTKKIGLNIVNAVEVNNETDAWWQGLNRWQSADEYAANLSACYDGHMGTLGNNVGIKTADPNMVVVMGGTAMTQPWYIRGIVNWSIVNRGFNMDGSVNLPFDRANYHFYANNSGVSQQGGTQGICPEQSIAASVAAPLIYEARLQNIPLDLTEIGYDEVNGSPIYAAPIGSKNTNMVKADWILRSCLQYPRLGINKVYFYWAYDIDPPNPVQFETCALLDYTTTTHRKIAGDYIYQANHLLAGYSYVGYSINADNIITDVYNNGVKNAYVVTSPTQTGRVVNYTLQGVTAPVTVYQPAAGASDMTTVGTSKTFVAGETPLFVMLS